MHTILILVRKDFARLRRDKAALILTFVVPLALIFVFGKIFGGGGSGPGPTGIPLAVVDESHNAAGATLLAALRAEKTFHVVTETGPANAPRPLVEDDLRPLIRDNQFRFAVVIPADLIRTDGIGLHLRILSNPRNEIETQMVYGMLQKTIFASVPQLLGQSLQERARAVIGSGRLDEFNRTMADNIARNFGGNPDAILARIKEGKFGLGEDTSAAGTPATPAGGNTDSAGDVLSRLVRVDNEQVVGKEVKSPFATRSVGGWAMQFLLFAVSASATALFHEKEQGLFQRLLSAPVTRADILWSKFLYGLGLGLVQLMIMFFAGQLLFGIDVQHHLGLLSLVSLIAAAACTSFGLLLAAVSPSPEAARGMSTLVILLMSAVGGAWFPISSPEFIVRIGKLTPVYWAMEGFQQVLWANASFMELLPTLGTLALIAAVVMAVAIWRFNRGRLFA